MTRSAATAAAAGVRSSSSGPQPATTKRPGVDVSPTTGSRSGAENSRPAPVSTNVQPEDAGTRRWTSVRSAASEPPRPDIPLRGAAPAVPARGSSRRDGGPGRPPRTQEPRRPIGIARGVQPQPRPHEAGEPDVRDSTHPAWPRPARENDGLGREVPGRRLEAGDPPGRKGHPQRGVPLVDPHARGARRQHDGPPHPTGPRHAVARKGERGLDRRRERGLPPTRLVGLEHLEVDPPGPLCIEGAVQEDFLGVVEGHGHRAALVVFAGQSRFLLQGREPVGEEVPGEEREVGERLGHGLHRCLGRHRAPGRRRKPGPDAGQKVDRQVPPGEVQGEGRRRDTAPAGDDDVRRREAARQAIRPAASRTGPLPGISGGPHLRSTRVTTARPTACTTP